MAIVPRLILIFLLAGPMVMKGQPIQVVPEKNARGHEDDVMSMASIPGKIIATGSWDGQVSIWDYNNGNLIFQLAPVHPASVEAIAITRDRKYIFTGCNDFNIRQFDGQTGKFIKILGKHSSNVEAMAVDGLGKFLFSGSDEDSIKIWDIAKGTQFKSFETDGHVNSIAITFDGKNLLVGTPKPDIYVYDLSGKLINTLKGHRDAIHSMSIAPNGKFFATVSNDRSVIIWEPKSFTMVKKIEQAHLLKIRHISYSSDSRFFSTASNDGSVKIWDCEKMSCVMRTQWDGKNHVAQMLADKNLLLAGGKHKEPGLRLWKIPMDSMYGVAPPKAPVKDSSKIQGPLPKKGGPANPEASNQPGAKDKKKADTTDVKGKKIETVGPRFQGGIDHLQSVDSPTVTIVEDTAATKNIPPKKIAPPARQPKNKPTPAKPKTAGIKKEE